MHKVHYDSIHACSIEDLQDTDYIAVVTYDTEHVKELLSYPYTQYQLGSQNSYLFLTNPNKTYFLQVITNIGFVIVRINVWLRKHFIQMCTFVYFLFLCKMRN